MDDITKYNNIKAALIAFCVISMVVSYNFWGGVQEKIDMRHKELMSVDDEYVNLKSTFKYIGNNPNRQSEVEEARRKIAEIEKEYTLYLDYSDTVKNDPVMQKYEKIRFFWMAICVVSFMSLGQLFKPVRWLMYAVLAGAGINMLRNKN